MQITLTQLVKISFIKYLKYHLLFQEILYNLSTQEHRVVHNFLFDLQ